MTTFGIRKALRANCDGALIRVREALELTEAVKDQFTRAIERLQ